MSNFFLQAYLSYRGLFLWLNWPGYISNVFLTPFLVVIMFGLVGRFASSEDAVQGYMIGITAYSLAKMVAGGVIQSLFYDRFFGTLSFLFVSPVSRLLAFSSRALLHLPNGLLSFATGLLAAWLILGLNLSAVNWLSLIFSVVIICFSSTAFALFAGSFAIVFREWLNIHSITHAVLLSMTGVILPTSSLPPGLSQISQLLPLTHGLIALRRAFYGGDLSLIGENLLLELIVGLAYALGGFLLFRLFEARSKYSGALEAVG